MRQAIGLGIIATGFLLMMILSLLQNLAGRSASYGGMILIGPIPIIFGSSPKKAFVSMIMAAGLMVLVFLLFRRHWISMLMAVGLSLIFFGFLILIWPPEDQGRKAQYNLEYVEEGDKGKKIGGGAVVMIGPVPIVLGSDHKAALLMIIALLAIIVWAVYLDFD